MKRFILIGFTLIFILHSFHSLGQKSPSGLIPDFNIVPEIKWTFKTGAPVFASPVVDETYIYVGSLDSTLYAIDLEKGTEIWRFRTSGEIRSDVCVGESQLYANGGDGNMYAIDKRTGSVVWIFRTKGEMKYDFADYFHSTPVLHNGVLYFGSGDGNLYAVNSKTGTEIWSFGTGNVVHTKPAINDGKVFFGSFDGYVYALNLSDGRLVWKFKTVGHRYFPAGEVQGSPFVFNGLVFIGSRDYNVYALDQNKGYCHWNKAFAKGWGLCTQVEDSVLYIGTSDERVLIAVEPQSGRELWKKEMEFLVFGNNAFSKNMLYLGTTNGKLHAFSRQSGDKVWSYETGSYKENRLKYFKSDDTYRDDIYTIIRSNEQFLDVECELGGIFSTPRIEGDAILFSSTNGMIYCLGR